MIRREYDEKLRKTARLDYDVGVNVIKREANKKLLCIVKPARRERTQNRRHQESPDSRESRLQVRRESARVRRQSERGLQRQQQHDVSIGSMEL